MAWRRGRSNRLHKIILELESGDLATELALETVSDADGRDVDGWTALARRGDSRAVALLLITWYFACSKSRNGDRSIVDEDSEAGSWTSATSPQSYHSIEDARWYEVEASAVADGDYAEGKRKHEIASYGH